MRRNGVFFFFFDKFSASERNSDSCKNGGEKLGSNTLLTIDFDLMHSPEGGGRGGRMAVVNF